MSAIALVDTYRSRNDIWPLQYEKNGGIAAAMPPLKDRIDCRSLILRAGTAFKLESLCRLGASTRTYASRQDDSNVFAIAALFANATGGSNENTVVSFKKPTTAHSTEAAIRASRLSVIQSSFGASMKMLSEILRISRPQLYKWFDTSQLIRLQDESISRLIAVEQLAREWTALSPMPLASWVHEQPIDRQSLLEMLTAPSLELDEIDRAFRLVAQQLQNKPKSRGQLMRDAGFTRQITHRSLPSDE